MTANDLELLRDFTRGHSQDAFSEVVSRHLSLVYSAALRQVRSPQLAEEVAQSVFTDLARNAPKLRRDTILSAWLYQVTRRTAIDLVRSECRRQGRERVAAEMALMNAASPSDWTNIEPLLDDAMAELDETDRAAVLLRYFENKPLREVGAVLGTSDDAAQKRVSRAVERLREFFSKRGVVVGTSALMVAISAQAVEAAPAGLASTISAAALAGTASSSATILASAKAIATSGTAKAVAAALLVLAVCAGVYQARQSSMRERLESAERQQAALAQKLEAMQRERDDATNRAAAVAAELAHWKSQQSRQELARLRGQVGVLRQQLAERAAKGASGPNGVGAMMSDPAMKNYMRKMTFDFISARFGDLFNQLKLSPEQRAQFTQIMGEADWRIAETLATGDQSGFAQAAAGIRAGADSQLKALLGDTGFASFKDYVMEIPARDTLDLLDNELKGSSLAAAQRASLLQILKAEPDELTRGIGLAGQPDKAFLGSDEEVAAFLQKVADSYERILDQAASVLSPTELAALDKVLSDGIATRIVRGEAFLQKR
jgi:RNA polymerase sigma factor (sigma-70 family)